MAKDVAALKQLRASIRVSIADASEPSSSSQDGQQQRQGPKVAVDACVQSRPRGGGNDSRIFLVSRGGVSVWRRVVGDKARAPGVATERNGGSDGGGAGSESGVGGRGEGAESGVLRLIDCCAVLMYTMN